MSTAVPEHSSTSGVLSESDSEPIIKSHFRYYLSLSILILLPNSSSLFNFLQPTLQATYSEIDVNHIQSLLVATTHSFHQIITLALPLTYSLFLLILFISTVGTIAYTTHHGFYRRTPVKLLPSSSIKFLFYTFVPLAATSLISEVIVILIAFASVLFVGLVSRGIELFLFVYENIDNIDPNSSVSFIGLVCGVFLMILLAVLLYVQVNWSLASVIFVVVESSKYKWGLESLRRSEDLVRDMRRMFSLLMYVYVYIIGLLVWGYIGGGVMSMGGFSYGWKSWVFTVQTMVGPIFVPIFMRLYMMAFGVLYVYCKAMRGELAWKIADEYVSLPFVKEKVPEHVVDVAQA